MMTNEYMRTTSSSRSIFTPVIRGLESQDGRYTNKARFSRTEAGRIVGELSDAAESRAFRNYAFADISAPHQPAIFSVENASVARVSLAGTR